MGVGTSELVCEGSFMGSLLIGREEKVLLRGKLY